MQLISTIQEAANKLAAVLAQLSDEQYIKPVTYLSNATIGQHARHIIELFGELQKGYASGMVNYDKRERNTELEKNRLLMIETLRTFPSILAIKDRPLALTFNHTLQDENASNISSTYYRELHYNLDHMIHHMALIKVAVQQLPHINLTEDFGIAASTQRNKRTCAQ